MGVRTITAPALVVLGSLSAWACSAKTSSAPPPSRGAAPSSPPPAVAAAALPSSPLERVARLKDLYRPHPDGRVLGALRDIVHIVGGQAALSPVATFDGTSWTIKAGDQELARLPEIPSFDDSLAACVALAHKLESSRPWKLAGAAPPAGGALPFDDEAFALLATAQASWAKAPTRAALHDAARALVALEAGSLDSMGVGDDLHARVLATVAMDKAFGGPTADLEAMLAWNLSYTASARALGHALPATDPLRFFFERDDVSLGRAATAPGAARWTKYLHFRSLTALGDRAGATRWQTTAFPDGSLALPILAVRSSDGELASLKSIATILPPAVLLATGRAAGAKDALDWVKAPRHDPGDEAATAIAIRDALHADRGSTLVRFDKDIDAVGKGDAGPFLDAAIHQTYLRAYMYAAEYKDGLLELDAYGSTPRAKDFLDALAPGTSQAAKDFRVWYQVSLDLAKGAAPAAGTPELARGSAFGLAPRVRVFDAMIRRADPTDGSLLPGARVFAPRIDTRPYGLSALANVAWDALLDVRLAEKYWKAAADTDPVAYGKSALWWAKRTDDEVGLRALMDDPLGSSSVRLDAVSTLETRGKLDAASADAQIDKILAGTNDAWTPRARAIDHLDGQGRYAHARAIAKDWLSRHEHDPGLESVFAHNLLADGFEREGRYADALAAVEPVVGSWQGGAMKAAARAHAMLGHRDEAEKLVKSVVSRYPGPASAVFAARVRWIGRDYAGAADALAHPPVPMRTVDWVDAGLALDAILASSKDDAAKALDALSAAGAKLDQVHSMLWQPFWHKHFDLAWAVVTRSTAPAGATRLRDLVDGYLVLQVWKGEPAAVQWLQPLVKPAELERIGEIGFLEGVEELVWTISADTKDPSIHDNLWLLRSASARRVKSLAGKLAEAKAHYEADAGAGTYWNEMGKYVVGLTDDKTMAALAHDAHTICEASFYMGARAQGEGRYADANDLYRSAVEASALNVGECSWASSTLLRWKNSGLSLARMGELAYPAVEEQR
jgi:tetratricopeptide (TPR) repeat protein